MRKILLTLVDHRTLHWLRHDLVLLKNRIFHGAVFRNPARIKPAAKFLNLGCGARGIQSADWFNADAYPLPGVDFVCDAARPLPFADGRFQGIYSEHFIHFLPPEEVKNLLAECRRTLRPGSVLRLSIPDGELYLKKYFDDRAWMLQRRGGKHRTPMEVVNASLREGFLRYYCFDYETLALWMTEAGFANVTRADFGKGFEPSLLIDQEARRFESLYVEGRRPAAEK